MTERPTDAELEAIILARMSDGPFTYYDLFNILVQHERRHGAWRIIDRLIRKERKGGKLVWTGRRSNWKTGSYVWNKVKP